MGLYRAPQAFFPRTATVSTYKSGDGPLDLQKEIKETAFEIDIRIETYILPIKICSNLVVSSTIKDSIDRRIKIGVVDSNTVGYRLKYKKKKSSKIVIVGNYLYRINYILRYLSIFLSKQSL